jgi:hypothetical protein
MGVDAPTTVIHHPLVDRPPQSEPTSATAQPPSEKEILMLAIPQGECAIASTFLLDRIKHVLVNNGRDRQFKPLRTIPWT